MKEFIENLISRLEAQPTEQFVGTYGNHELVSAVIDCCVECVNQLAEEYKQCNKPSCKDCEVYDKEKHYCPKWCEVIKHTAEELAEEYNNDFCEWEYDDFEDGWQTSCGTTFSLCDSDKEITHYCPCCGKKIKVVE